MLYGNKTRILNQIKKLNMVISFIAICVIITCFCLIMLASIWIGPPRILANIALTAAVTIFISGLIDRVATDLLDWLEEDGYFRERKQIAKKRFPNDDDEWY